MIKSLIRQKVVSAERMESQAAQGASEALAAEVRAEMAAQNRTAAGLAEALGVTAHTAGRRLSGATPFDVVELALVAMWLGTEPEALLRKASERERSLATKEPAA